MVLIHTPRTILALSRGFLKKHFFANQRTNNKTNNKTNNNNNNKKTTLLGFGIDNRPHIYSSRAGFFDFDVLGHMNNAAYLAHAEYARWEMSAENGLIHDFIRNNAAFVVTSNTIRYRREIKAMQRFQIESSITAITPDTAAAPADAAADADVTGVGNQLRDLWMVHNFRQTSVHHHRHTRDKNKHNNTDQRILAQILVKAVLVQNGRVVDPKKFLLEHTSVDAATVENLTLTTAVTTQPDSLLLARQEIQNYMRLEQTQRAITSQDDKALAFSRKKEEEADDERR